MRNSTTNPHFGIATGALRIAAAAAIFFAGLAANAVAAPAPEQPSLKVLPPIVRGNLALFPVVADRSSDSSMFITLDEGIRSGQVVVSELGDNRGIVRPGVHVRPRGGAEVNRLVLENNSRKPLLLLAGEIVTGGKQDRVIGADRIVPPDSGPIDLGVFCVEPGRWVGSSANFGSMGNQMAQPSVRIPAMAEHNQQSVWDNVRASNEKMAAALPAPAAAEVQSTTSYAKVFSNAEVAATLNAEYGGESGELAISHELEQKGAVGVVVAIDGQIQWADVFGSTDLLVRYLPKLVQSYVAQAVTERGKGAAAEIRDAQDFLSNLGGGREVIETEPGIFRRSDVTGDGYRVFTLTALLPKTAYIVHIAKMRQFDRLARF